MVGHYYYHTIAKDLRDSDLLEATSNEYMTDMDSKPKFPKSKSIWITLSSIADVYLS